MARRSGNDVFDIIVLLLTIVALPIMLIIWVVKAIISISENNSSKPKQVSSINASNYYSSNNNNSLKTYKKTNDEIEIEAKEKYGKISDAKKSEYLKKRKRFLKILYISLSLGFLLYLFIGLSKDINNPEYVGVSTGAIVICSILLFLSIMMIIAMIIHLKKSSEILILEQIKKELKKLYNNLTDAKIKEKTPYVKQHSEMYKNIQKINNSFTFDRKICRVHEYSEYLNSKRQFDTFNFDKWIIEKLDSNQTFFNSFKSTYEDNYSLYNKYKNEYFSIKKYRTIAELENSEVPYEIFNIIEKKLFNDSIQAPITAPTILLNISYTSSTGRNRYHDKCTYNYSRIIGIIQDREKREQAKREETERIKKVIAQKKEKERRLRELDKLEVKLAQKEQEINKKEKEFLEATKEHIYTADKIETPNQEIEIDENLSLTQKLKLLKEKFDNGEITYEEYQTKRKELM